MSIAKRRDRGTVRIVIGVTGHRRLKNETLLAAEVAAVLEKIKGALPAEVRDSAVFRILSPLAEGADRLVARIVMESAGGRLDVVLPMEKEEYAADFKKPGSREEFERLLAEASSSRQLASAGSRADAYGRAGRYVVDHCDVLIAVWDGGAGDGEGGTAEIVEYARKIRCPLFWIRAGDRIKTAFEPGRGISPRAAGGQGPSYSMKPPLEIGRKMNEDDTGSGEVGV